MGDSAMSVTTSGTKKKKKNVFKRIAKGMAFKNKKKHPDDASVVGVSVSDSSVVGPPRSIPSHVNNGKTSNKVTPSSPPIQIVLLLMDPNTRRFELLQLEFDAAKALVSDVLLQIEQSATETTLRDMVYSGVCDCSGLEMISSVKLSQFCNKGRGNEVILAMPKGMGGQETAVLARPILEDEKVLEMLRPCGVQLTFKSKKASARNVAGSQLTKIVEEEKPASKANARGLTTETAKRKTKSSYFPTQVLGIIISVLFYFTAQHHNRITRPMQSGLCLLPGEWISQCGIWELFPGSKLCDSASLAKLSMGKDGKLRYFSKVPSSDKIVEVWSVGTECTAGSDANQCVENLDCQGAAFTLEGNKWFVQGNGDKKLLPKSVVEKFT